jgi:pimeloyl-ACP methyl ester carboxylesterase
VRSRLVALALLVALLPVVARTAAAPTALKTLELGSGPTVVFVHQMGATRMAWMPVARRLLAKHRVVLVDLPGHGESPMPGSFTLEAAAEALDGVLARQKPESTVVVGKGMGGVVALIEARVHPERMKGLVLVNCSGKLGFGIPDQDKKQFLEMLDQNYDQFLKMLFSNAGYDSAEAVAMHAQAVLVPKVTMMAYLRELLYADPGIQPKNFRTPLLALVGVHMWPAGKDSATVLKETGFEGLAGITVRRLGAGTPGAVSAQPESLAAVISDFAARAIAQKK